MHSTLRFGGGHALHAVNAGFVFHESKDTFTGDLQNHFLESAHLRRAAFEVLAFPAAKVGIALIRTHQFCGKQRGFVATGTGADFDQGIAILIRVGRQKRVLDFLGMFFDRCLERRNFFGRHR